jgi:hypothetical protein
MAFPTGPTNGQIVVVTGITYEYSLAKTAWIRRQVGIADLTIAGNVTAANVYLSNGVYWSGNSVPYVQTLAAGTTNQLQYKSASGFAGANITFDSTAGNLVISSVTNSANISTGALVVRGGVGVTGNVYSDRLYPTTGIYWAGNNVSYGAGGTTNQLQYNSGAGPAGANIIFNSATGNLVISSITPSANTTSGALVVSGGLGVAGNIYSGSNVYVTNGVFWAGNGSSFSAGVSTGKAIAMSIVFGG